MKKKILIIVVAVLVILINSIVVYGENNIINVKAKVVKNNGVEEIAEENQPIKKIQKIVIRILEGEYENEEYEMNYVIAEGVTSITSNVELKCEDKILVALEETAGEVVNIKYMETINFNYTLYIIGIVIVLMLLLVSRKRAILIYLITILVSGFIIILSLKNGWNLILTSSIISLLITVILYISINKLNIETLVMIIKAILAITISAILIYILFDIMKVEDINIKITDKLVNIKEMICSATILFSCGIYNAIAISGQYIFYANNKPYKRKSDNIIEGQRTLKLQ